MKWPGTVGEVDAEENEHVRGNASKFGWAIINCSVMVVTWSQYIHIHFHFWQTN